MAPYSIKVSAIYYYEPRLSKKAEKNSFNYNREEFILITIAKS